MDLKDMVRISIASMESQEQMAKEDLATCRLNLMMLLKLQKSLSTNDVLASELSTAFYLLKGML